MKNKYTIGIILILIIAIIGGLLFVLSNEKKRELILTDFKPGQEYQFGEVEWNSSMNEVENLLDCTLEMVPIGGPKDFDLCRISDVVYVLNGYEAKTSVEFREDKLVFIDFTFAELENPIAFFKEIISVWQETYGPDYEIDEKGILLNYQWKTETTQLAVTLDGNEVIIYLCPLT
jgi:hypothetical protein